MRCAILTLGVLLICALPSQAQRTWSRSMRGRVQGRTHNHVHGAVQLAGSGHEFAKRHFDDSVCE